MANIWLHSDWHLWHQNLYTFKYTDREGYERRVREPFKNQAEGDAFIEQEWRRLVKPSDHVWSLGDWTMFRGKHNSTQFIKFIRSLPGHKRTLLGNHDHYDIKVYQEAGFEKIRASNVLDGILLTHYPVHPSSIGYGAISINVHGHTHQNPDLPSIVHPTNNRTIHFVNVSVERTNYAPIAWEEVKQRIKQKQEVFGQVP